MSKYVITQQQLDEFLSYQEEAALREAQGGRKLTLQERLRGRIQAGEKNSIAGHTYAGQYKGWDRRRFEHPWEADQLNYESLRWLEGFYAVRPAVMFIVMTMLASVKNAVLKSEDPDVVAFHEQLTLPRLYDLAEAAMKALTYGVSFNEVIRESREVVVERKDDETEESIVSYRGTALVIDEIRHNTVDTVTDVWKNDEGKLDGYTQDRETRVYMTDPASTSWAFVYSVNDLENPVWGHSEIGFIYDLAWWINSFIPLALRRAEKEAGGSIIGHAPVGQTDVDGEMVDNLVHMANILSQLQDHMVAVFPYEIDPTTQQSRWGWQEAVLSERSDIAMKMIEYLNKWVFLTLLVPPDVLEVASKPHGSRSAVETLFEAFLIRMQGLADRFATQAEDGIIEPLTREHFGEQAPRCELELHLSHEQEQVIHDVFVALLTQHADVQNLDLAQMAKDLGVPVKQREELVQSTATPPPGGEKPPEEGKEQGPKPLPATEEKAPALTLEVKEGMRWEDIVEEARLLIQAGLPADTEVRIAHEF